MNKINQFFRILYIYYVLAKHGVDRVLLATLPFAALRLLSWCNPWNWCNRRSHSAGVVIRRALEDLGPIFVKFGQMLSTRYDLLPADIIAELAKLQDRVPPFPAQTAKKIIECTFKKPIIDLFCDFSPQPIASASIAQVHAATLADGRQMVVKIRRPTIEKIIRRDLALLHLVAKLAELLWTYGKRLRLRALVSEFEQTILDELDFMREAANASQLRRNFKNSSLLYVPEIYWPLTTDNILVMERIYGIRVSNQAALQKAGVNNKKLAERSVEIFFTQVFRDSFFHGDMHPGNIFIAAEDPEDPRYIAIDFGIMGSLSPTDQHYLAENLLAFLKRDYRRVAILHIESGWVPASVRVEEFEAAIRTVCEPIFERPLRDISFAQLLLRLFQTAGRFKLEIQPQLFLLQKTLLNVEGLARRLDPDIDLWQTARPFLQQWMRKRYSPRKLLKHMARQAPYLAEQLLKLPGLCHDVLQKKHQEQQASLEKKSSVSEYKRTAMSWFLVGIILTLTAGYLFILIY